MKEKLKNKNSKGITLIALVVTIIVLLILAGVTIATLTAENGILTKANNGKEQTEIGKEKEQIKLAINAEKINQLSNNITIEGLQKELDNSKEEYQKVKVKKFKDNIEILFENSNRYYVINSKYVISDPKIFIEDKYPGDITKDKDGNVLNGTSEKPYKIYCIEDLIEFSQKVDSGYFKYNTNYNVILMRDLDFESELSYMDSSTKLYNEFLGVDNDVTLIQALTSKEGKGFLPIGSMENQFEGIFDGKNYIIENIYENRQEAGFFGYANNATIKNIKITGEINSEKDASGLICIGSDCKIYNCINKVDATACNSGGICCKMYGNNYIKNSANIGKISGKFNIGAGGILGLFGYKDKDEDETIEIYNSYNWGDVSMTNGVSYCGAAGMVGYVANDKNIKIYNCYNIGNITSSRYAGAIIGTIQNDASMELNNCYFLDNVQKEVGSLDSNKSIKITSSQCKNEEKINEKSFIDLLNNYVAEYNDNLDEDIQLCFWTKDIETGYAILNN